MRNLEKEDEMSELYQSLSHSKRVFIGTAPVDHRNRNIQHPQIQRASNPAVGVLAQSNGARETSRSTQDPPAHVVSDKRQWGRKRAAQIRHAASGKDRFGLPAGLRSRIRQSVGGIGSSRSDLLDD